MHGRGSKVRDGDGPPPLALTPCPSPNGIADRPGAASAVTHVFRAQQKLSAAEFQRGQRHGLRREICHGQESARLRRAGTPTGVGACESRVVQQPGVGLLPVAAVPASGGGPPAGLDTAAGVAPAASLPARPSRAWPRRKSPGPADRESPSSTGSTSGELLRAGRAARPR